MNCGACKHWDLRDSPLRVYGFGLCKVEPNLALRAGKTLNAQNMCRIGKFTKAEAATIARREKEASVLL